MQLTGMFAVMCHFVNLSHFIFPKCRNNGGWGWHCCTWLHLATVHQLSQGMCTTTWPPQKLQLGWNVFPLRRPRAMAVGGEADDFLMEIGIGNLVRYKRRPNNIKKVLELL